MRLVVVVGGGGVYLISAYYGIGNGIQISIHSRCCGHLTTRNDGFT